MIRHSIHFINKLFSCIWFVDLPYRLVIGDLIFNEFFDNKDVSGYDTTNEGWVKFSIEKEYFEVDQVIIDHMGNIEVWIK